MAKRRAGAQLHRLIDHAAVEHAHARMVACGLLQCFEHALGVADLLFRRGKARVHRVDLARMNAGLAVEAQRAGHFKVVLQALSIVDVGKDRVLRGNARPRGRP